MSATRTTETPSLNKNQWNVLVVPAIVLFVMAILQLISFNSFKNWLNDVEIGWSTLVAIVVIIAELWGAASLLRVGMSRTLRRWGVAVAILVSGFWFVETMRLVSGGTAGQLPNSGYFGKYLTQTPGWLTAIEVSILLLWVVYSAELLRPRRSSSRVAQS
ncbi:MAG TPA: hypothetical protein VFP32_02125 [Candidatus Saccharimonadales bacterium]|nr:hypothetical protein [Candidatus Saccharimonadales bacterium]